MSKKPKFRVSRDQPGGINPNSFGRKSNVKPIPFNAQTWADNMGRSAAGAKEVMVKITGGGRDGSGAQAHFEYIDRHGKLEVEEDRGEVKQGKAAGAELTNDWGLDIGRGSRSPHSRQKKKEEDGSKPVGTKLAFNIILSMPPGTPPEAVLNAAKKFARENFANRYRYAMVLHTNDEAWNKKHNPRYENEKDHGKHPHVHLVVKADHEYAGQRLNPRKADLRAWREDFAKYLIEEGVFATATRRDDRGLAKTHKRSATHRSSLRSSKEKGSDPSKVNTSTELYTEAGDSTFMRKKLEGIKRELRATGALADESGYKALLNVREAVQKRYADAIKWLREQGREAEARRFETTLQNMPPVRTENQVIADELVAAASRRPRAHEQDRAR